MGQPSRRSQRGRLDAWQEFAEHRLNVPKLPRELGNIAEARPQCGLDRTNRYERKRRYQSRTFEGLEDLPPAHRHRPQTSAPETMVRIKDPTLNRPAYG